MDRALPIDEPQILISFDDDAQFPLHHRVLLRRCGEGVWVVATPDLDVQVEDLREHNLVALGRGALVPTSSQGQCYMFRELTEAQLDDLHAQAARIADLLGVGAGGTSATASSAGGWRVSDTAAEDFGVEVPADVVMNLATGVQRESIGMALFGDPARWVAVERVNAGDLAEWRTEKRLGGGRDPRLGGLPAESSVGGLVSLAEALGSYKPLPPEELPFWPHVGPRVVLEVLRGVRTLGLSLFTFHEHWARQAGIHREAAVAWEHRMLCTPWAWPRATTAWTSRTARRASCRPAASS